MSGSSGIDTMIVKSIAALAIVLAVAVGALYWFIAGGGARERIERASTAWLGRPVRIGDATVAFSPRLALRLEDVRVGDPERVTLPRADVAAPLEILLSRRFDEAPLDFRFTAVSGTTTIDVAGMVQLAPRVDATVKARSEHLEAADLMELVAAFTPATTATPSSSAQPPQIVAEVDAPSASIAGVGIKRLTATVRAVGADISIEPVSFDAFAGRHNGWFDAAVGETLEVRLGSSFSNIDAAQLTAFAGAPGAMTGRLDASMRLGARGGDLAAVLASLRGAGEVVVTDGVVRGLDLVETVVRFLGRAPQARDQRGTPFDRLAGNFAMGDGRVRSDDLTLHSAEFDIFANGTLRFDTEALDGRAQVVISEALSAQAGTAVFRYAQTGNRIVLPATIAGTLGRPQVRFDTGAAVRRAVGNEIGRRLTDLLDLVRGAR
jgi:uncharacterized protein involved in outer membrane biogenesis